MKLRRMASLMYCDRDQAHEAQARDLDHAQTDQRNRETGTRAVDFDQGFNTAFIERLKGTFRERLASLTRRCRHAVARVDTLEEGMYLIGCTSNFCFPHQGRSNQTHFGCPTTPAMAAALTDHPWSIRELLGDKVAPVSGVKPS